MSELYRVRVEELAKDQVVLRVTTVHPDAGPPPKTPSFPVNLLVDLWRLLQAGQLELIENWPEMHEAEAIALAAREPWGPVFQRLCALSHGVDEPATAEEIAALDDGKLREVGGRRIIGWGTVNGRSYVHYRGDEEAFSREAAALVRGYVQDELENQDRYRSWPEDGGAYPRARLSLTLEDPALLGFVRSGVSFETAAYF